MYISPDFLSLFLHTLLHSSCTFLSGTSLLSKNLSALNYLNLKLQFLNSYFLYYHGRESDYNTANQFCCVRFCYRHVYSRYNSRNATRQHIGVIFPYITYCCFRQNDIRVILLHFAPPS